MKRISHAIAILLTSTALSFAGDGWQTDWAAAKARSVAENKPILINLTGSDWCASCVKIKKEVFSQEAFKNFAAENLILMEADFPKKTEQTAALKKQNAELEKQYATEGFPSVFLLDSEGKKLSEDLGGVEGDANVFVTQLKALVAKAKKQSHLNPAGSSGD